MTRQNAFEELYERRSRRVDDGRGCRDAGGRNAPFGGGASGMNPEEATPPTVARHVGRAVNTSRPNRSLTVLPKV